MSLRLDGPLVPALAGLLVLSACAVSVRSGPGGTERQRAGLPVLLDAVGDPHGVPTTPDGLTLVHDPEHDVDRLACCPGHYWLQGRYWRHVEGAWQRSRRIDGPWTTVLPAEVPRSLGSLYRENPP